MRYRQGCEVGFIALNYDPQTDGVIVTVLRGKMRSFSEAARRGQIAHHSFGRNNLKPERMIYPVFKLYFRIR